MPEVPISIVAHDEASPLLKAVAQEIANMQGKTIDMNGDVIGSYKDLRRETMMNVRSLNTMNMAYRDQNIETYALTSALSSTGAVFRQVNSAFQQFNVMQIRSQQAAGAVTEAQVRYNESVERYGISSTQAINAKKQLALEEQNFQKVQQQTVIQTVSLGVQLGTQLPANILVAISALRSLSVIGLPVWLGTVATGAAAAIPPIVGLGYAFSEAGQKAGDQFLGRFKEAPRTLSELIEQMGWAINKASVDLLGIGDSASAAEASLSSLGSAMPQLATGANAAQQAYAEYMNQMNAWSQKNAELAAQQAQAIEQKLTITIEADTSGAESGISAVNSELDALPESKTITITTIFQQIGEGITQGINSLMGFPLGGTVPGYGPKLAIVHGGETVSRAPVFNQTFNMSNNNYGGFDYGSNMRAWGRQLVEDYRRAV